METFLRPLARSANRQACSRHHNRQYGISHWASVLTSIPRAHGHYSTLQPTSKLAAVSVATAAQRSYTTGTVHARAAPKTKLAPRITYQPTSASTWIISDGSLGADKEAVALAKGLGMPWVIKRVQWRRGLQWLPIPFKKLIMDYHHVVNRKHKDKLPWFLQGDSLNAPFPSYVIGTGNKTIPGVLQVSRMSGKATFSAYIHFPFLPFIHFDQVFLQRHEAVVQLGSLGLMKDQKNYFRINSTLNTITSRSLEAARAKAKELGLIPKSFFVQRSPSPIVAVLVGGPNEDCRHNADRMANRLARLVDVQNCRLLITYSQRTAGNTKLAIKKLQERIQDEDKIFIYDPMVDQQSRGDALGTKKEVDKVGSTADASVATAAWNPVPGPKGVTGFLSGRNPYEAMLALADKIVVTADSIAMTNEALATGKPVYILGGELARGKLKVFHRYLADQHATRAFRPGRVPITASSSPTSRSLNAKRVELESMNNTADPLSYPGDHPPWSHALEGQGPAEARRLAERLQIMREARIAGRRVPEHVSEATC
ncbi:hypothetical protein BG011_001842 [Mortierella polycephala]|uniref:Uncharacterized protein n=1 Tax=Mortierella polycephala TaxID=41804 RepID=A0A9P6Q6N7_9FUNG|nr:hypothetical protein BG011_001842 [Mortierella polycephala]